MQRMFRFVYAYFYFAIVAGPYQHTCFQFQRVHFNIQSLESWLQFVHVLRLTNGPVTIRTRVGICRAHFTCFFSGSYGRPGYSVQQKQRHLSVRLLLFFVIYEDSEMQIPGCCQKFAHPTSVLKAGYCVGTRAYTCSNFLLCTAVAGRCCGGKNSHTTNKKKRGHKATSVDIRWHQRRFQPHLSERA